jgi:hypothetical protein
VRVGAEVEASGCGEAIVRGQREVGDRERAGKVLASRECILEDRGKLRELGSACGDRRLVWRTLPRELLYDPLGENAKS